ncbi:PLxRFG domain-containing protein [Paracoccus sp. MA]|uniref:PLxRFG domain-containing protein n=1 Tax=Paracoccus sp. MA TaxID=2895796 RepID=UPI001E4F3E69|nr:PLxRFG domain-containing protein [Paracoccus sp. MA]UFM64251.1 PLxRFG domain-containing protein [Paracoccus sp. MA]
MAVTVSGTSPLSHALQSLGVQRPTPEQKPDPKSAFESLSRETNVPANVLIALDEASGGAGDLDKARRHAAFLGEKLAAGAKIEDAVAELAGDAERAAGLMNRSYDIADELYPEPVEPPREPGIGTDFADFAKSFGAGAINAAGGAVQSLGAIVDDGMRQGARHEIEAAGGDPATVQGESVVRSGSRAAADAVRGVGDDLRGTISERGQRALEGFQPGGELLDPSSWTLGDDPSVRGALLQTAQGLGSMAPIVAMPGPAGAAAFGALSAAGEGAESGREFVEHARGREGEAGPAYIEALPGYRALRDQGMSHEDAAEELARQTESESGAWQMVPGALGGAATNRIMRGAEGVLNAGGRAARAIKKGAAGALEEGVQEAVEGMASAAGIEQATGGVVNTQQDSFANFLLGAMTGGGMGVGAGLVSRGETDREQAGLPSDPGDTTDAMAEPDVPLLPAPGSGGTIFGQSSTRQEPGSFDRDPSNPRRAAADQSGAGAQFRPTEPPPVPQVDPAAEAVRAFTAQPDTMDLPADAPVLPEIEGEFTEFPLISDTGPDGSGAGAVAAPGSEASLSVVPGAAATNPIVPGPAAPAGPVERIAQGIAAATPPALPAPPARFPDQKPGSAVRFGDPASGQIIDGVFLGETDSGARVRVQGREIDLTPEQFDAGRDAVAQIEAEQKRAEAEAKAAGKALPAPLRPATPTQQEAPANVEPSGTGQAPDARNRDAGVRMDDVGAIGSEGPPPGRGVEQAGGPEDQGMAAAGMPAGAEGQQPGPGGLGGLDVADDPGELRGSLNSPGGAGVDVSEPAVREQQADLSRASAQQAAQEWPWRGKKMNSRTRGRAIADYFAPGNIVPSYGGGHDRVVSFDPKAGAITVEAVEQRDDEWVPAGERRVHSTLPEDRALVRGPVAMPPSKIDAAAAEAHPEPTDGQKEAGNYRKGHTRWNGLDLTIENARGSERRGTGPDGTEWSVTMPAHYGYFKRTEGADGDHVDFYMGENPDAPHAYVIDQVDAETGAYDEAKVMLGFDSAAEARAAHGAAFSDGRGADRLGGIKKMTVADLKDWLANGNTKKPVSMRARRAAAEKPAPAPQKRPLMNYVAQQLGGIYPRGKAAEELRHRGVNSRTAPGLWRRAGHTDLDNIPAADHPDLEALVGRSDDGIYLDPGRIIEALVEEVAGRPQPLGEQAVLQQEVRAREEAADHARAQEADHVIVSPADDPRPADERRSGVEGAVDDFLAKYAPGALTESERADIIETLIRGGGDIDALVVETASRRPIDDDLRATESGLGEIPFGDADGGERSGAERIREDGGEPASSDPGRLPAEERGADREGQRAGVTPATEAGNSAVDWLREKAQHDPAQDETITVTPEMAEENGIEPGDYLVRYSFFRGEVPYRMKAQLRGIPDRTDFALSEFIRFGNTRATQDRLEYTKVERERVAAPATESGADGKPQTVIPGAERSEAQAQQADADRTRSEMQARQQQSKIRRAGGNDGDAGPLFDTQNDLFSAPAAPADPAKGSKIEDFGEKITGARKDVWASYADQMRDAAEVDVSAEPLSKSWPAPDYEKLIAAGVEPWKVSFIRAARDSIPSKPQKSWRLSGWVEAVTAMRGLARDVMDGKVSQERLRDALLAGGNRATGDIMGQMKLYEAAGHGKSLKGMTFGQVSYTMLAGTRYNPPKTFWEVSQKAKATAFSNMPRTIARAETEAGAIEQFKQAYGGLDQQQAKASKARKWLIHSHDGGRFFTVGTKIGSSYIQLRRIDGMGRSEAIKEARRIVAEESEALQEQLDRLRDIPADRKPENAPRVGIDHRSGADVTPEVFGETFGFRGVQFGNWVGGGRRQQDLNDAFDALMDLAGVLDIPPRALSLNGTLGLAFGARGTGGVSPAAAHYEPDQVVINLTKMNGAGSLAHEWFHAFDNYFARAATDKKGNYITDRAVGTGARVEGVRPEVMDALVVLRRAIAKTGLKTRSANIDKTRSKAYWSTGIEMHARAFESYVIAKLQDQSIANDYLANVVEGTAWQMKAELSGLGDSYPYLKPDEIEVVRPAFDALFNAIQTRETDRGVELYQRDMREPVATLAGNELGEWSDMLDLQRKARNWYRENLQGKSVINKETGWEIRFTRVASGKIGGKRLDYLLRAVPGLEAIIANAQRIGVAEMDRYGRQGMKAFHRFVATISVGGDQKQVHIVVREMEDGRKFYDLNLGADVSARTAEGSMDARLGRAEPELQIGADKLNLSVDGPKINPVPASALRGIAETVSDVLRRHGLAGRVSPKVVRGLLTAAEVPVTGSYRGGAITVDAGAADPRHVMRHEIIHALRDAALWGRRYGLFTPEEWRVLARAARSSATLRRAVETAYADLSTVGQTEEMIAEMYADWARDRDANPPGPLRAALERIRSFFRAMASALRGDGFQDAAHIMERIASGEVGGRGPAGPGGGRDGTVDAPSKEQRDMGAIKAQLSRSKGRALGMIGNLHWKNASGFFSSLLTDAMGRNDTWNILSLVPGHPLFEELGKGMPAAQKYLREKQAMDAWRNDWQARAAAVVDGWTRKARKNPEANDALMDLMHASTLAGVDPSREGSWRRPVDDEARRVLAGRPSPAQSEWAQIKLSEANDRERTWHRLRADFDALPAEFRDLYQQVRDEYAAMADEQDAALMSNIRTASRIAVKRADREHRKELQRIRDEGLTGQARAEALEKANKRKTDAHARAARGGGARLQQLRQMFESNRLAGPYFPLARFGNYFVTIRDSEGKVTSFSRFQTEREQRAWIQTATERGMGAVEHGVLGGDANLKGKVDPTFVAEVESLLADAGASDEMMDAVWQRWLETLPDQSVRTARIHRKGRLGFNKDAIRAFSSAMFHGAHQTARLRYGLEMEDSLDDAEDQAKQDANPNRAGFVVREMRQRHAFTMSPTNNPLVSSASGLAFVWYLGMSPASAIVNLSQTTIVGVPLMATRFRRAGVTGTVAELGRALRDFGAGRGWAERSERLTADEKAAMKAGYDRGVLDKTQSHDLAAVAESGLEYNPTREKVMRVIGWGFHHTERMNREVTFLAAYRMARAEGLGQAEAVDEASRQVWKVHFDYQNTSRPRVMQSDMGKILTTFRNFTVNMLYRLFRDTHQAFAGADAETRREARAQLIGISLSMFAHAGIKGVWGFGILSMLLGAVLPGDDDDFENFLQDALLIEGDGAGVAAWNWIMGMVLNGVPGTVLDMDLTNRIGMPDLWFRSPQRDLEGKDLWSYYVEQVAGPVAGIGGSVLTGASMLADGQWLRGGEKMVPNFAGDLLKTVRYVGDGVTTYHGDPILERVNPYQALVTALGFTPGEISERYRANNWLKNQELKLERQRKTITADIARSIKDGEGVTPALATRVREWNVRYPFYPITADSLRQSISSRQRMSRLTQGGVNLNPRLDRHLREQVAPPVH